jgi:hypothetical protein
MRLMVKFPLPHADCWRDHDVPTRIPHSIGSCLMKEDQPAVFVVDDDESVRTAVARALRTVGLEVASFGPTPRIPPEQAPHAPGCTVIDVTSSAVRAPLKRARNEIDDSVGTAGKLG